MPIFAMDIAVISILKDNRLFFLSVILPYIAALELRVLIAVSHD